jgi:hypothetical protein
VFTKHDPVEKMRLASVHGDVRRENRGLGAFLRLASWRLRRGDVGILPSYAAARILATAPAEVACGRTAYELALTAEGCLRRSPTTTEHPRLDLHTATVAEEGRKGLRVARSARRPTVAADAKVRGLEAPARGPS